MIVSHSPLPHVPSAVTLWQRALVLAFVILGLYLLDRLTILLADFWFLQTVELVSVFWTNFRAGAALFVSAFAVFGLAVATPAMMYDVGPNLRRLFVGTGVFVGIIAGYFHSCAAGPSGSDRRSRFSKKTMPPVRPSTPNELT